MLIIPLLGITCKGKMSNVNGASQEQISNADNTKQKTSSVEIKILNGYFFKNTHKVEENPSFFEFSDKISFENYLGIGRTMGNRIDKPDFPNQTVMAIVYQPTQTKTEISVIKAEEINGNTINIYFKAKMGESLSYTMQPLLVFCFEKKKDLTVANFITNGKTIKSLTLASK